MILLYKVYGINIFTYGLDAFFGHNNIKQDWARDSNIPFPRVTMCDLSVRRLGNNHRYAVQCVLPSNYFMEKIVVFQCVWIIVVLITSLISFYEWVALLVSRHEREHYVQKHLVYAGKLKQRARKTDIITQPEMIELNGDNDAEMDDGMANVPVSHSEDHRLSTTPKRTGTARFCQQFLHWDGVFLMHMIGQNTNRLTVTDITGHLYEMWKICKQEKEKIEQQKCDDAEEEVVTNQNNCNTAAALERLQQNVTDWI